MHSSESLAYFWLVAFALAATLGFLGIACQVLRLGRVKRTSWGMWTILSWLVAALCISALFERLDGWLTDWLALVAKTSLIALLPLLFGLVAWQEVRSTGPHVGPRLSWGLIAANTLAAFWASGSFYEAIAPEISPPLSSAVHEPIRWVKIEGAKAYTDRGNVVNLMRLEPPSDDGLRAFAAAAPERVIRVAGYDDRANCHGWVFTGGQFAVSGDDVDTILVDNQYELVERPQAGDLIVYRGARGEIVHAGVVRLVEEGLVLIESKWGALARYLHQPCDQGYSTNYQFYRSPRDGHLIHWKSRPPASPRQTKPQYVNDPTLRKKHAS